MDLVVERSKLSGSVEVPASKSHTIRAVVIAGLAQGVSEITNPLESLDTKAAVGVMRAFGADVQESAGLWRVHGVDGKVNVPQNVVDVLDSGTTLYVTMATAALAQGHTVFTGDASIRTRPAQTLIDALNDLGAHVFSTRGNGSCPIVVGGPMKGGRTRVAAVTSQYVSSLLINCPLSAGNTEIEVTALNERPYVQMTLDWLDGQGIRYENHGMTRFVVPGGQRYRGFARRVPGDFSSATFFLVAAAVTGGDLTLLGLDMKDSQGDKAVVEMLERMGAEVEVKQDSIRIRGGELTGTELDLNATPDALPALAVAGCLARGETRLVNVAQARVKETDRIAVMCGELKKMGADVEERPDGLVVRESRLRGASVDGHQDHRVVMALTVAGMCAQGRTRISTAEAVGVTFPNFVDLMRRAGATLHDRNA